MTDPVDNPNDADPLAISVAMRVAAVQLMSIYAARVTTGYFDDPAIVKMRAIYAEAAAVDAHDIAAQKRATAAFRERREALLRGEG